jgi:hypothetical protein
MIRPDRIKSEMFGGVGWRQTTLTGYPTLDADNLESRSGLIFQDATSFVTIQNIYDCQQDDSLNDAGFNTCLDNLQDAVILETCQKIQQNESDFIQSVNLFPYEKLFKNTLDPDSRFVGFQIKNTRQTDVLSKINWIELSFDSIATFNVYLYNSNKPSSPIKTVEVTTVANESVVVNFEDWELADAETFKGGYFYWGYFEDDLGGAKALKKDYDLSDYQVYTKCNYISPMTMSYSGTTIDPESITETNDTYGLNFCIDSYNDYTELFIRNKAMFYQAIYYQMAEKIYNLIRTSTRSNIVERLTNNETVLNRMAFELYGNAEAGIEGTDGKLKRTIQNLRKTLFYKPLISRGTLH